MYGHLFGTATSERYPTRLRVVATPAGVTPLPDRGACGQVGSGGGADPEHPELQRKQAVVAHEGHELLQALGAQAGDGVLEARVVEVSFTQDAECHVDDSALHVVRVGRSPSGTDRREVAICQSGQATYRLMGVPLERAVLVRRYGEDGHLTRAVRQGGAVPEGCTELLQGRPQDGAQEHGVERTFEGTIVADQAERLWPRSPGSGADQVVEPPLLVIKGLRDQPRKSRHFNPFAVGRFGMTVSISPQRSPDAFRALVSPGARRWR